MSEKALGTRPLSDIVPMAELGLVARLRTIRVDRTLLTGLTLDRKSTRLNSSHSQISYAVFCLKKKNTSNDIATENPCSLPPHGIIATNWPLSQAALPMFHRTINMASIDGRRPQLWAARTNSAT